MGNTSKYSPYHPDIGLFLVLIPIISAINYYLTYSNIQFNGFLLLTFTIDTVQGYLAWLAVRKLILYFDKVLPYEKGLLKRLIVQFLITTTVGLLIIILTTEMVSYIAKGKAAPLDFYTIDVIIIGIWFFFINAIYLGLYYYNKFNKTEQQILEEKKLKTDGFIVNVGNREIKLDFQNIVAFYSDNNYTVVIEKSGKNYFLNDSLDRIMDKLPKDMFFRLNRKYIVNHFLVTGFKKIENGKLLVNLQSNDSIPSELTVSRTKAPSFKRWFRP